MVPLPRMNESLSMMPIRRRAARALGAVRRVVLFLLLVAAVASLGACASDESLREQEEMRRLALLNYDEGMRHAREGNDLLALDYLERSVMMSPRAASHYEVGRIQERLGMPDQAMDAYRAALELAPDHQEARFALLALEHRPPEDRSAELERERAALLRRNQQRMAKAAEDRVPTLGEVHSLIFPGLEEESELPSATDPVFGPNEQMVLGTYAYHLENGRRFERQGNWERAADEYRAAMAADPQQIDARLNLGDMMLRIERHARAYAHYSEAIRRFPGSPKPLLKMGNYYDSLERPDLARDYYSQALFMDPEYAEALNNLAAIEIRNKNFGEAQALLEMAVRAQPGYPLPYLNLGIAQENSGNSAGALASYEKYVELGGDRSEEVKVWIAEMEPESDADAEPPSE